MFNMEYDLSVSVGKDLDQYKSLDQYEYLGSTQTVPRVHQVDEAVDSADAVAKMGFPGLEMSLIVVLVVAVIIIGIIMYNKKKQNKNDNYKLLDPLETVKNTAVVEEIPSLFERIYSNDKTIDGKLTDNSPINSLLRCMKCAEPISHHKTSLALSVFNDFISFNDSRKWQDFTSDDISVYTDTSMQHEDATISIEIKNNIVGALNKFKNKIKSHKENSSSHLHEVTDEVLICINEINDLEPKATNNMRSST